MEGQTKKRGNPNWVKGIGGNPYGRPKMLKDFTLLARTKSKEAFDLVIEVLSNPNEETKNRIKAAEIVLDRAYGKCTTDVQMIKDEVEIPEDIKRMTPEELIKELKDLQ